MYDVIVLGATFAAAGIAQQYQERCLVIERRAQAGYEYFGALDFSVDETTIYSYFNSNNILFCKEIVSVQKDDNLFACVTHGVQGFCTYYAKKVIDTRSNAAMSLSKTFNLLIDSNEEPVFSGCHWKKVSDKGRYVVYCPIPLSYGYAQARGLVRDILTQFSETQKVILSAHEFDYHLKEDFPKMQNGILYAPSKFYQTPQLSFEAGLRIGEEEDK